MALHPILSPTSAQTIARLGVTALRTAQSMQTRKGGSAFYPTGDGQGVLVGDMADHGVDKWDPETGEQNPLWEGISQEELDAKADNILAAADESVKAQIERVDADLAAANEAINKKAEETLEAAKQDTAKHVEQVNKDIEAANQKIDETAAKTLADANAAAQAKVDAVNTKVDAAQAKADANAAAIVQTNKTVEANKQAADAAQAQLDKTITEHGSVLDAVGKDITQAKKDILANAAAAAGADSKADKAQQDATKANAAAATANKAAADAADDAAAAKQDAAEAAGIANGKADVLIQSTAPSEAMRKATTLWIDTTGGANTPKRWNGSAWVAVTDKQAVDAANAAAAAQTTADNAQTTATRAETLAANADAKAVAAAAAANNAQTTADSKNTVYMQSTDPHDEADKAALIVPGDLWWQTSAKAPETYWTGEANNSVSVLVDHSDEIVHMWVWNGSRWNNHVLYAQDMLVNGSIVSELLAVDCVEARHISVGAIEADKLAATALYGKVIKGGTFLTANERLIIDDAGLLLKDSGGNATITMLAGDGSATFRDVLIVGGTLTTPTLTSGDITGGTISGATVTGGTVQTSAQADTGIKLTGGNLDIYRSDQKRFLRANESGLYINDGSKDVLAFFNDAGTWKLKLTGPVTSGGEISGATVTGGTVQTSAQADTGIKLTGGNLDIYRSDQSLFMRANESGLLLKDGERTVLGFSRVLRTYWEGEPNNSVSVLSDGWQLTLDGAIQSGGTISGATVVGGVIRTNTQWESTDPAKKFRGLVITDGGMFAYKNNGKEEYSMAFTAATGELKLDGAVAANASLTGATINGGVVYGATVTTNSNYASTDPTLRDRGVWIKSNGLVSYDASNRETVRIDAASGRLWARDGISTNGMFSVFDMSERPLLELGADANGHATFTIYANNLDPAIDRRRLQYVDHTSKNHRTFSLWGNNNIAYQTQTGWDPARVQSPCVNLLLQFARRGGLVVFRGRVSAPNSGDNTLIDNIGLVAGEDESSWPNFELYDTNRSAVAVGFRNNTVQPCIVYIPANTRQLVAMNGPWDWVDLTGVTFGQ